MIRLLVLAIFLLLGGLLLGRFFVPFPPVENSLRALLWEERTLDLMAQVALVFSGVLGVLALLRYGK